MAGQLPERGVEVVDDAPSGVEVSREEVDPVPLGEVDAVAEVVPLVVGRRCAVDRRNQQIGPVEELIARGGSQRVGIRVVEQHGADHGLSVDGLPCDRVGVGHELGLELQVPAVDRRGGLPEDVRVLRIGAPAVHVELHGREGLPLEVADVYRDVAASEDAVHVGRDVGLPGEPRSDVCRDVEADVLPVSSGLVAGPYRGITLRPGPSVERDDERARVVSVVGHDVPDVCHAVQAERIASADPRDIGLQHPHPCVAHLLDDVALEQGVDAVLRMEIRLGPESDLHAPLAGIFSQLAEVFDISVERRGLAVSGSVPVVRQQPPQGHVVGRIAVDHGTCREGIVARQLAVERFADSAVVLLALLVPLSVLEEDSVLILLPVVAVVGVQVSFVEPELGNQHGIPGQLIEVVEQPDGRGVDHHEEVEIARVVRQRDLSGLRGPEVVKPRREGVPHDAVSGRRPVEGRRRGDASVGPLVRVDDADAVSLVREASVLHASAVEILVLALLQRDGGLARREGDAAELLGHRLPASEVGDAHLSRRLVYVDAEGLRGDRDALLRLLDAQLPDFAPGVVYEDLRLGRRLGVTQNAPLRIEEEPEDVRAVEIDGRAQPVGPEQLDGCGVQLADARDGSRRLGRSGGGRLSRRGRGGRAERRHAEERNQECCFQTHGSVYGKVSC